VVLGGGQRTQDGYFVEPTIIADVESTARIAQEEIFGPVLAVIRADSFDHALAIANGTEYGLTGALYSRDRVKLERARHEFHVGNLYLNRKCTGALVDVQPFGGFNMSGTDSKAGGRDYLLHFMLPKTIAEKW
jgi:1-pyrroline-5-carboxylate dehydrogenase